MGRVYKLPISRRYERGLTNKTKLRTSDAFLLTSLRLSLTYAGDSTCQEAK